MSHEDPPIRVCIYCGSPNPEELLPQCAHGIVATVRGKERRAAAQLWVAFRDMHAARANLVDALDEAVSKGQATMDASPGFNDAGENVVPLHNREVVIDIRRESQELEGWEFDAMFPHRMR